MLIVVIAVLIVFYHKKKQDLLLRSIDEKLQKYSHDELVTIIEKNYSKYNLTSREIEVAAYYLVIDKRKDLAAALYVSEDTVKSHISHIFKKLKISSRQSLKENINKILK